MKPKCDFCHKNEATGTIWIKPAPGIVGGRYLTCDPCKEQKQKQPGKFI